MIQALPLLKTKREAFFSLFFLLFIFTFNLSLHYQNYKTFTADEVFKTDATILNIYKKENYNVLKLYNTNFTCFTSINKDMPLNKLDKIDIFLVTQNISFLEYLKGFYAKSFGVTTTLKEETTKTKLYNYIELQHENKTLASIYQALFLAVPVDSSLRDIFASYGISHLFAISGFHVGLLSVIFYFLINIVYSPIHSRYLPYRNKRYDNLLITTLILFLYLLLTNIVPSLLRSFVMFVFGIYLLRANIKILSFSTLLITVLVIIALFPKLLFSLSLWFSVIGVFYIFLFIKYFKDINKYLQLLLFNFWIFLAINPITHYFFQNTSIEQLLSPFITILFTLFYPVSLFFHIIGFGWIFDSFLAYILALDVEVVDIGISWIFLVAYIAVSLTAIYHRRSFYLLNFLLIGFNLYFYINLI